MVLNLNSMIWNNCIRKTILSEDGPSAYNITKYIKYFDNIIIIKATYFNIRY